MVATAIDVHIIETEKELEESFAIRRTVFMGEQGATEDEEFDEGDKTCTHYLAKVAGVTAGTARLNRLSKKEAKLERICVLKDFRGYGVGRKIVEKLLKDVKDEGFKTVHLYGQTHALGFYQSFGFKPYGDEFMDARIPHRKLKLEF